MAANTPNPSPIPLIEFAPKSFTNRSYPGFVFAMPDLPRTRLGELSAYLVTGKHSAGQTARLEDISVRPDAFQTEVATDLMRVAGLVLSTLGARSLSATFGTVEYIIAQQQAFGAEQVVMHRSTSRGSRLTLDEARDWLIRPPKRGDHVKSPSNSIYTTAFFRHRHS